VFTNLIANARDAMPGGGRLRIAARRATGDGHYSFGIVNDVERMVHVEVRDSGTGIDPIVIKHIFDPLFTTKRTGGTGLGLAIVHRIIDSHGGAVFAESQDGLGTTFHIFLPLGGALAPQPARDSVRRPVGRLLLIEDDALVAAAIGALLQDEGIAAEIVTQGSDAVPAIERSRPTAVVLDLNLPDLPGEEVYRRIAERWPDLPVVFSTGHADESKLAEYLRKPNVTYLLKPYELEALLAAVGKVVDGAGRIVL
jgi:two-component system cell cycle sensor histidine kinase/response regulator CckA